ncbi:unnamed protein product [Dibothriocephalus latus]|uniref:Uncharacterized protein n=1 Tax=Dibothriocephalus latus TaxID=60516 RepID=A0A3P7PDD7_DIBLA|nr:unnamed protein product [Dibothriocephalus latus]
MTSSEETNDKFYGDLHINLTAVPKADIRVIFDGLDACVGTDHAAYGECWIPGGLSGLKDNGLILLQTCTESCILLANNEGSVGALRPRRWSFLAGRT